MENLDLRTAIARDHRVAEADAVQRLRALQPAPAASERIHTEAVRLAERVRATLAGPLSAESFLRHYGLSRREGVVKSKGRRMKGAFRQRSCVRLISGTSTMRTPLADGASIARTRAAFIASSVTRPSRSALSRVAGIHPSTA